jgi:glucosamine 6-phosphate synthetase-like amidotransferase/phosphosugar isomerase protein|tara:strand:- start:1280 stop:1975 length:696 start_codon:yes stop_codon:yes gene_type:complete
MCGIYGSNDFTTFEVLSQANRKRGNFSTGVLYKFRNSSYNIQKIEGDNLDEIDLPTNIKEDGSKNYGDYLYLGHNQAPTSSEREYEEWNAHPFVYGDWIVAHNGVLTNMKELVNEYVPHHDCAIDSSIIPAMLYEMEYKCDPCEDPETEQQNILYVIERLKGTFALWIMNVKTMNVYIARQGSTLFYKDSNISSIKGCDYEEVKEGILYSYSSEGVVPVDGFLSKSPFLTL